MLRDKWASQTFSHLSSQEQQNFEAQTSSQMVVTIHGDNAVSWVENDHCLGAKLVPK